MTTREADRRLGPPELPGYAYVRPLGSGGFSDVYLYRQEMPRREVAVKVLLQHSVDAADRGRFYDEANLTASLASHPSIVTIHHADVAADGRPYLVMEYYPSENLRVRSLRERLRVETVVSYGIQIACAVETAHRAGILHRDIKPANILVNQYDIPGLADFGIAATIVEAAAEADEDSGLSIPWSPPEVLRSARASNELSDVWSLGATLYTLLVGRSPFEVPGGRNTSSDLMRRIETEPPQPLGRPDVPASLERLILQTLAKSPAARPASALALAQALQGVEGEMGLPVTPLVVVQQYRSLPREVPDADDTAATRLRAPGPRGADGSGAGAGPDGGGDGVEGTVLRHDRTRMGRRAHPPAEAPEATEETVWAPPPEQQGGAHKLADPARDQLDRTRLDRTRLDRTQLDSTQLDSTRLESRLGDAVPVSPADRTPELEPTRRRPGAQEADPQAPSAGDPAASRRRLPAVLAAVVALAAAGGIGAYALGDRGERAAPTPTAGSQLEPDSPLVDVPPAVTGLVLTRGAGGTWSARWTPPAGDAAQLSYQYQWVVDGRADGRRQAVSEPALAGLRPPKGDSVCLEIITVRGSRTSAEPATKCLPAAR